MAYVLILILVLAFWRNINDFYWWTVYIFCEKRHHWDLFPGGVNVQVVLFEHLVMAISVSLLLAHHEGSNLL